MSGGDSTTNIYLASSYCFALQHESNVPYESVFRENPKVYSAIEVGIGTAFQNCVTF